MFATAEICSGALTELPVYHATGYWPRNRSDQETDTTGDRKAPAQTDLRRQSEREPDEQKNERDKAEKQNDQHRD
ncbi:MAG: hypothetical protein ACFHWZ_04430 [Phycisphaerales bacterium]